MDLFRQSSPPRSLATSRPTEPEPSLASVPSRAGQAEEESACLRSRLPSIDVFFPAVRPKTPKTVRAVPLLVFPPGVVPPWTFVEVPAQKRQLSADEVDDCPLLFKRAKCDP